MLRILFVFFFLVLISCHKKEVVMNNDTSKNLMGLNDQEQGKFLMENSDCLACHLNNQTAIGPSFQDIANKYNEKDVDYLADKIINGGAGVWGDVPMSAHPNIQKTEAQKIVKYILLQKN